MTDVSLYNVYVKFTDDTGMKYLNVELLRAHNLDVQKIKFTQSSQIISVDLPNAKIPSHPGSIMIIPFRNVYAIQLFPIDSHAEEEDQT